MSLPLPPTLGIIMIVKDEEANLTALLPSLKGVADELVVVDTGSTDRSCAVAQSHGATLGHFTWCDDFAAARNASIALARADYLLWLDADDRIDAQAAAGLIRLKKTLAPGKNTAYYLNVLSLAPGQTDTLCLQLRIFPRVPGVRFTGRVHEQLLPSLSALADLRCVQADITIRHQGYADAEQVRAKGARNLALQRLELSDGHASASHCFAMAMSCQTMGDHAQALTYIAEARCRGETEDWFKYSFNLATDCLMQLGRRAEAIEEARRGAVRFPESGVMHYNLGVLLLGDGRPAEALAQYRAALAIDPVWAPPLTSLGLALAAAGDAAAALEYLERAYALTGPSDSQLSLGLGRVLRFQGRLVEAHQVYRAAAASIPDHRSLLAALALTSVATDDVEQLLGALEALMRHAGLDPDRELPDTAALAMLCAEVGAALLSQSDPQSAAPLAEASLLIDPACWQARLLAADIARQENTLPAALAALEAALTSGAPAGEVERRLDAWGGKKALP